MLPNRLAGKGVTGKEQGAAIWAIIGVIIATDKRWSKPSVVEYKTYTKYEAVKVPQTLKLLRVTNRISME